VCSWASGCSILKPSSATGSARAVRSCGEIRGRNHAAAACGLFAWPACGHSPGVGAPGQLVHAIPGSRRSMPCGPHRDQIHRRGPQDHGCRGVALRLAYFRQFQHRGRGREADCWRRHHLRQRQTVDPKLNDRSQLRPGSHRRQLCNRLIEVRGDAPGPEGAMRVELPGESNASRLPASRPLLSV
jgi:hypothetical protein